MISCTEFIPLYSEFFKYLDKRGGHEAVMQYWFHISDNSLGDRTNPHSLISFIERDGGFEGAVNYWKHTLTEEACDLYRVYDPEKRFCYEHIRHCPSRGMLNSLEHIEPYYDYCEHCNVIYGRVLNKFGIVYERDHSKINNAECSSLLYENGNKPAGDYTAPEKGRIVVDMKSEDNKYLHRDFHLLGDLALAYCGEQFGEEAVVAFLEDYTRNYYKPQIEKINKGGLQALKEWIEGVYEVEEASHLLHADITGNKLTVTIDQSPVIEYMHSLNQKPSKYYIEETRTLYRTIAEACHMDFNLEYYQEDGGTRFVFCSVSLQPSAE